MKYEREERSMGGLAEKTDEKKFLEYVYGEDRMENESNIGRMMGNEGIADPLL